MINTSININDKPSAIRYPRGTGIGLELPSIEEKSRDRKRKSYSRRKTSLYFKYRNKIRRM